MSKTKNKWNLKKLYKTDLAWERDFSRLNNLVNKLNKLKGKITTSTILQKALQLEEQIDKKDMKLFTYAALNLDLNKKSVKYKEMLSKVSNNSSLIVAELSWLEREILDLPKGKLKNMMSLKKLEPHQSRLKMILNSKTKKSLTHKEERVLNLAQGIFDSFNEIRNDIELNNIKFPKIISSGGKSISMNHSNVALFHRHPNREFRKQAYMNKIKEYKTNANSFSGLLKGHIHSKVIEAKVHGFDCPVSYLLYEEDVSRKLLENFLKENKKYKHNFYEYLDLKRKKLKYRKLYPYDIFAPLKDKHKKIPYQDALKYYFKSIEDFGDEYMKIAKSAFKDNWVDSAATLNKADPSNAGFCFNPYITHPHVFITYQGDLESVVTLSHEMGHAVHGQQTNKNNSYYDSNPAFVLQEAIAFTNEILTFYKIIEETRSKNLKQDAIWGLLEMFYSNLLKKGLYTEFEIALYDMITQNKKFHPTTLSNQYKKMEKNYIGKCIDLSPSNGIQWAIGDDMFSNFYNAKYLIAFCLAVKFVEHIQSGDDEFIYRYNKILKMGDQEKLADIISILNIDMKDYSVLVKNAYSKFKEILSFVN